MSSLPPNNMQLKAGLSDDSESASITLMMNGLPLGHIVLQAPELEDFVKSLGQLRAAMAEPVALDVDPGSRISAIHDPAWRLRLLPSQGVLLVLRHPGLGWLGNLLPLKEARVLGQSLVTLSEQQE